MGAAKGEIVLNTNVIINTKLSFPHKRFEVLKSNDLRIFGVWWVGWNFACVGSCSFLIEGVAF